MISMIACHSTTKLQVYQFIPSVDCDNCSFLELMEKLTEIDSEPRTITLKNDSVLEYIKRYGGLGYVASFKYKIIDNELNIDSLDIYGRNKIDIQNRCFLFNKDSLVNKITNEKYYNKTTR